MGLFTTTPGTGAATTGAATTGAGAGMTGCGTATGAATGASTCMASDAGAGAALALGSIVTFGEGIYFESNRESGRSCDFSARIHSSQAFQSTIDLFYTQEFFVFRNL
mmetsp:Transcript_4058/g.8698  ORF Transcript_4058/g.8698 Transcript_4058/m.8698 type:complete len:108 (+) Transcript_4058:245-568(+)